MQEFNAGCLALHFVANWAEVLSFKKKICLGWQLSFYSLSAFNNLLSSLSASFQQKCVFFWFRMQVANISLASFHTDVSLSPGDVLLCSHSEEETSSAICFHRPLNGVYGTLHNASVLTAVIFRTADFGAEAQSWVALKRDRKKVAGPLLLVVMGRSWMKRLWETTLWSSVRIWLVNLLGVDCVSALGRGDTCRELQMHSTGQEGGRLTSLGPSKLREHSRKHSHISPHERVYQRVSGWWVRFVEFALQWTHNPSPHVE